MTSFAIGERVKVRRGVSDARAGQFASVVRVGPTGEVVVRFDNGSEDDFSGFELEKKSGAHDSNSMFTVDLEFRDGRRTHPQFVTQQEAVAFAGRMAMDGRIVRSEVKLGEDAQSGTWEVELTLREGLGGRVGKTHFFSYDDIQASSRQEAVKKALARVDREADFDSDNEPKVERVQYKG